MTDTATIGYAAAADAYRQLGWPGVLPLPAGRKWPPPTGYTGDGGKDPSGADIEEWKHAHPDGNLCLRLPDGVIGIDVDAYAPKTGARTLAEAEKRWGPLPHTYRTTSRTDGVSGIRLFRVPTGTRLCGDIKFPDHNTGDVETVQRHHRYALAWPSTHPNGNPYLWINEHDGSIMHRPPAVDDLSYLPQAWLDGLI